MTVQEAIDYFENELDIWVTETEGGYYLDGDTFVTEEELVEEAERLSGESD